MTIILISGQKGVGKDTFAACVKYGLVKSGYATEIIRYTDLMEQVIASTFGITLDELDLFRNNPEKYPIKLSFKETNFREVLQRFGTEGMKPVFGESVWASLVAQKMHTLSAKENVDYFLLPDFRFPIEFDTFTDVLPFATIKTVKLFDHNMSNEHIHLSEFDFDYIIENSHCKEIENMHNIASQFAKTLIESEQKVSIVTGRKPNGL